MLVPRSWLTEYCALDQLTPPITNALLADAFNELGLIVEGFEATGEGLDGIITVQVRSIRPHPNAEKIRLVDVVIAPDANETLQIACGAWNFNEGDKVPLATLGTTMPDGMVIERRKLRGGQRLGFEQAGGNVEPGRADGVTVLRQGQQQVRAAGVEQPFA